MPLSKPLIANCFFLVVLFPYLSPIRTPFDVQPYAVFAALLLITAAVSSNQMKLPAVLWLLGIPVLYATGILWIPGLPNIAGLRALNGYVSLFAIAAATYLWARYINVKLFPIVVYTWLVVALIQLLVYRDFAGLLLARFSPDYRFYRGMSSLATEPAHYAGFCFFCLLLNELFYSHRLYTKRQYLILGGVLFLQMIMSLSALGLVYLICFILFKLFIAVLLERLSPRAFLKVSLVLLVVFATFAIALQNDRLRSTRALSLAWLVLVNPARLMDDKSIQQRLSKVVVPVVGLFRSRGTGFGLTSWEANGGAVRTGSNTFRRFPTPRGIRIASGWGSSIFELGVVGVWLIAVVSWVIIRGIHRDRDRRGLYLLILLSTHVLMINATPIAFPPFSFLIGLCAVFVRKRPYPPARSRTSVQRKPAS